MAELRRIDGSRSCRLMTEHLVGRGPQCALRLMAAYVSAQHALIRWDGSAWEILDRGSRNGTQLNGALLEPGRGYRLLKDAVVTFGHTDERWALHDAGEPQTMAVALDTGQALLGAHGIIGLPSTNEPACTLFQAPDGSWKVEHEDGEVGGLVDGQLLEVSGRQFRFCCPSSSSATEALAMTREAAPTLCFCVSSDEDFVELSLEYPERKVALGSRSHNYLMLTLARQLLADRAAALPEASCGWMDKEELADGFNTTPQQVDGEVFRIRKHFSQQGLLPESATIIERRPRTKQIRLGIPSVRIDRK